MKLLLIFICFYLPSVIGLDNTFSPREYCNLETFRASCAAGEVILMDQARFGRMRLGRCLMVDLGYIGCGGDALHVLDHVCSGKQTCEVLVGDKGMGERSDCTHGLLQYLEASYHCVKAHTFDQKNCPNPYVATVTSLRTVIVSDMALGACVETNQRWKIATDAGQNMNITLINFDIGQPSQMLGKIIDSEAGREKQFGSGSRHEHIMMTQGQEVDVLFYSDMRRFALQIEVQGCSDLTPPGGAWLSRDGDVTEIGCHSGSKAWTLRCEHNQWVGAVGYCGSDETTKIDAWDKSDDTSQISPNVVVFGACSLVLFVSSIVFLAGVLMLKRKPQRHALMAGTLQSHNPPPYTSKADYPGGRTREVMQTSTMPRPHPAQLDPGSGDYSPSRCRGYKQTTGTEVDPCNISVWKRPLVARQCWANWDVCAFKIL